MTFPLARPSTAAPIQRHRRLLLTLPAAFALPMLTACGGGSDLIYETEQALYMVGEAITPNKPREPIDPPRATANMKPTFSVKPPLPAGLTLNAQTGVISGTPTKLKRQATYTISATARDVQGCAEARLRITVTGRGDWRPAATIPGARQAASMSPLSGRRFMFAGGLRDGLPTNTVEIYNEATGTWSTAAPMLRDRDIPLAVVLKNGRVLVLSGDIYHPEPGGAEIYDPVANTWTATGRMKEVRTLCTATLLPSGKVLVAGGINPNLPTPLILDTVELYDPDTGVWTVLTTRLATARAVHAAALLPDGKTLLLAGGNGITTAELYKVDGSATKAIPFGGLGRWHQAVKLDDGSVLVMSDASNESRRFNPANASWTTAVMVGGARVLPTVTVLADGRVLVAGGESNTAEIYNPDVNRWTAADAMDAARMGAASALLGDGSVLVVSGYGNGDIVDASERYIP
ncbi:putative Ig domain-containing protein [Hydrogenophaga sp.]|uniref:putative Ig domain-containing protein n=1 Tax=Hydrogenophaga sp. TaxID=1904254 RepID=UPI0027231437|nr:putative Ig domain-containing protein [Hydrogenophaga sp.]MDO9434192.1 putative Ig domain-containing protein [Hydrogenophaga sp.]